MVNSTNPLRISLLSISPQNRAILEFFFAGAGKTLFRLVPEPEADVLLVDFDFPGAEQEWQTYQHTHKPLIALAMRERTPEHGIWLAKPLTSKALTEAAERLQGLVKTEVATTPIAQAEPEAPSITPEPPPIIPRTSQAQPFGLTQNRRTHPALVIPIEEDEDEPAVPAAEFKAQSLLSQIEDDLTPQPAPLVRKKKPVEPEAEPDPLKLEQRWRQLCGSRADIHPSQWRGSPLLYPTQHLLQQHLKEALKVAQVSNQPVQLKIDVKDSITLLPQTREALSSLDIYSERFSDLCTQPLEAGRVQLYIPNAGEIDQLPATLKSHCYDLEALIWTLSLLTSNGRAPESANLDQRMILTYWPNFTRLEFIPHAMRLAATWQQRAGTVFEIAQWLNIPQRYVLAFYNAATLLDLLVVAQGTTDTKEKEAPKKNRGLFSRLLKRLLGGGGN